MAAPGDAVAGHEDADGDGDGSGGGVLWEEAGEDGGVVEGEFGAEVGGDGHDAAVVDEGGVEGEEEGEEEEEVEEEATGG